MKVLPAITALMLAILAMASVTSCHSSEPVTEYPNDTIIRERIDSVLKDIPAKVGYVIALEDTIIASKDLDSIYPMMSVFKLHVAMALVDRANAGKLNLDSAIHLTTDMLKYDVYSPIYQEHPRADIDMSISDLLHYSLNYSDNNASDILINILGGPEVANDYLKQFHLNNTQIKWIGYDMHLELERYFDNYTTPRDALTITKQARKRKWLHQCLLKCQSGQGRIPGLLPDSVQVGHKTGTGGKINGLYSGYNDVGFVNLPDGRYFYVIIFMNEINMKEDEIAPYMAQISKIAFDEIEANYWPAPMQNPKKIKEE